MLKKKCFILNQANQVSLDKDLQAPLVLKVLVVHLVVMVLQGLEDRLAPQVTAIPLSVWGSHITASNTEVRSISHEETSGVTLENTTNILLSMY